MASLRRMTSLALVLCCLGAETGPERRVHENVVASERNPHAQIRLPKTAQYLGAEQWELAKYWDDIEMHAFVDADAAKSVQRVYWVQFEAYLPSHPEIHHTYNSPRHATMGGLDFYVDTWTQANTEPQEKGSDGEHFAALLRAHGYAIPANMMCVRFVHLMDAGRKELMIIYGENLAPTGYTVADLKKGGKAHAAWPALEKRLIEDAKERVEL